MRALGIQPVSGPLSGELSAPGDKSISHRALILGTLAAGDTTIAGLLDSADVRATARACQQLGMRSTIDNDTLVVSGVGGCPAKPAVDELDMGNSGTAMRLLAGVLSAQPFPSRLTGDSSLSKRPMNRIIKPLTVMGAKLQSAEGGTPPIRVEPAPNGLAGIDYTSPVASAQVKSCVLLAGLFARGSTRVAEPRLSRDHTERMLLQFGVPVQREIDQQSGAASCTIEGPASLRATDIVVPGDISSAAFVLVAGAIVPGSEVTVANVGLNPTRDGIIRVMESMGADVTCTIQDPSANEPVASVTVRFSEGLTGVDIPEAWVPSLIDEFPAVMVLAAAARGATRIRGATELRVKESDRISVMAKGLSAMGVAVREYEDGIDIEGGGPIRGATVDGALDHRCAMSLAVLGQVADRDTRVEGAENIATSYPEFAQHLSALGGIVEEKP